VSTLIQIDLAKATPRPLGAPAYPRRLPPRAPREGRRWVPPGRR
jgi:hypothetical protein